MASTFNAFSSLLGSQEPSVIQNQLAKKKKNKKKPKKQGDDGLHERSTPEASVGKQSVSVPPSNGSASSGHNALLTVADAVRQVERAARQGNRGAERMTLWNSWITQVEQTAQGRGVAYRAPDGSEVDFKQMILTSQALELTGESCIQHPLHGQTARELHALLQALLPSSCAALVPGLAEGIKCLGETLHGSGSDLELHATQTVRSILSALKTEGCLAAKPAASSAEKFQQLAQQAEEKLQHIRMLESQQGSGQSSLREQAATFAQIVDCYAGQLDVACSGTGQPAVAGLACEPLQALEAALAERLEQAEQGFRSASAPSKDSAASTRSALEALDRQVSSVQGVMQQLEAQLACQKALLKGLQEQRQQLLRGQQQADTSAGSRAAAREATPTGEDADTCRLQMQVVRDLTDLLRRGGLQPQEGAVKAATSLAKGDVPASYMQAIDQMLKTYLLYMESLDTKYVTASLRLQRQKRLAELAAKSGKASEDDDKLLAKLCQDVDDIKLHSQRAMAEVHRIVEELDGRWSTLHASVSAAELTELRQNVDHFIGLLERKHQELMSHPAAMQLSQPPNLPPMAAPVHSFGSPAAEAGRGRPGKWTLDQVLQMDLSKHVDGQPLDPQPQNQAAEGKEGASPPVSRADVEAQIAMLQAQLGSMPESGHAPAASTATTASTAAAAQAMVGNGLGQRAGNRRRA